MLKEKFFSELAAEIAQRGWPGAQARRMAREAGDHWEELVLEARERGLDGARADDFARERLGHPAMLVANYGEAMRASSWAGRHPVLCFVALPPLALIVWFLWWLSMGAGAVELYAKLLSLKLPGWGEHVAFLLGVKLIYYTGAFAVPAFFWWWGRRSFQSFHWLWLACGICALHGLINHVKFGQHALLLAYGVGPVDWLTVFAPLLIAAIAHAWLRYRPAQALVALAAGCLLFSGCASSKITQHRAWIGGEYKRVSHKDTKGLLVTALSTNTPAARSGLREGDLIVQVAGRDVRRLPAFQKLIDAAEPGSKLPVGVVRNGTPLNLELRAGRETFKPSRALVVGLLLSREWDLWPDPDFSLIALGYKRQDRRLNLDSPESRFELSRSAGQAKGLRSSEGWEIWLPVVSLSSRKRILSQTESE